MNVMQTLYACMYVYRTYTLLVISNFTQVLQMHITHSHAFEQDHCSLPVPQFYLLTARSRSIDNYINQSIFLHEFLMLSLDKTSCLM